MSAGYLYSIRSKADLNFLRSLPSILYIAFILLGAASFFASFNLSESIVAYSRLITAFIAFITFGALISARKNLVGETFTLLGALCVVETFSVYRELFNNLSLFSGMNEVIYHIRGNTGNKNVLAASIAVKLPVLIHLVLQKKGGTRTFFASVLLFSVSAVALLNARASYIGALIGLLVMATGLIQRGLRTSRLGTCLKGLSLVAAMFVAGIVLSESVFRLASKGKQTLNYTSATERFSSIGTSNEASTGRLQYWGFALDFISLHPLAGGGFGNWGIHEIPYERHFRNGFGSAKHVHNDFLEVTADTGIPGGAVYFALFVALGFFVLKSMIRSSKEQHEDLSATTLAAILSAYMVDAFFNFPLERPNMQMIFSFTAAGIVATSHGYPAKKTFSEGLRGKLLLFFLLLSIIMTTVSYKVFKSFRFQTLIADDWDGGASSSMKGITSYEVLKGLPDFPNINELSGLPIACVKAKYLVQEKKYEEAFRLLDADKRSNPYQFYAELIRSKVHEELGNKDSALYYAKLACENRPSNLQLFQHYNGMLSKSLDSSGVRRTYYEFRKWNKNPQGCHAFVLNMYFCTRNLESFLKDLETAYREQPSDSLLHFDYAFYRGGYYQDQKRYPEAVQSYMEALPFQSRDEYCRGNLAYCHLQLKEYGSALAIYNTLIEDYPNSGKYYNYRAICRFNLNDRISACRDVEMAVRNGFQVQEEMRKACYE
ncbi:MAG: hypothetical protein RL213_1011 [Bacteroidota bacterium]